MTFKFMLCRLFVAIFVLASWALSFASADNATIDRLSGMRLLDTKAEAIVWQRGDVNVFCFLGTECPLAKLYGPRLQRMADQFSGQGVTFVGVNSNVQDSAGEVDQYAATYEIRFPIAKDVDQSIADQLDAARTPEVIVMDRSGIVRYRGRIDDQYEPGIARPAPTRNDLKDAITALLAGRPVANPRTKSVGCLITRMESSAESEASVTFSRDIAPILNQHCVECHREGEIAPFALTEYDEVVGWGEMMLEVIDQKRMPPWHADPDVGSFIGARELPAKDRDLIADWIDQGMAEGDAANLPPSSRLASRSASGLNSDSQKGWHLDEQPDVELEMRARPFRVPEDGVIEYQYFVVDPGWKEDRWIRAAQVVPGDYSVVHHAIVFVRPPDGSHTSGVGWLGAYVPGQRTVMLPPGHARRVPAGSKLVFQMHYTPNGRAAADISKVGVWFADSKKVSHEVVTHLAINHHFEIPPGVADYQVRMSARRLPAQGRMLGATPHMHLRGKSFLMTVNSGGQSEPVLHVPNYDFNWQHWYAFKQPIDLADVDSIDMTVTFDNSKGNPFNPGPEDYVSWGDQTWEEMAIAFFDVASPLGKINSQGGRKPRRSIIPSDEEIARREAKVERLAQEFMAKMDKDQNGVIEREETPHAFRRFGFRQMDWNGDGRIDIDEARSVAEQRR